MKDPTFEEICREFDSEEKCVQALRKTRWPHGFSCPKCAYHSAYTVTTRRLPLYECKSCGHQTSPIAGTILEKSRVPLPLWFRAIFLHSQPEGISAFRLSQVIGVTYKTAWLMGHKIRHAINREDECKMLSGLVRIAPVTYGQPFRSTVYRHPQQHPLVIGASWTAEPAMTRVKIKQVPSPNLIGRFASPSNGRDFLEFHVDMSVSSILSDVRNFVRNRSLELTKIGKELNTWLNRTFHGVGPKHLQLYLDQFCFLFTKSLGNHLSPYDDILTLCARTPGITYPQIISRPSLTPIVHPSVAQSPKIRTIAG